MRTFSYVRHNVFNSGNRRERDNQLIDVVDGFIFHNHSIFYAVKCEEFGLKKKMASCTLVVANNPQSLENSLANNQSTGGNTEEQ